MTQGRLGITERATLVTDYTTQAGAAVYVQALAADLETDGLVLTFNNLRHIPSIANVEVYAAGYKVVPTRVLDGVAGKGNKVKCAVYMDSGHAHAAPAFTGAPLAGHPHDFNTVPGTATFVAAGALGNHQHNITTVAPAGGGFALTAAAGATSLEHAVGGGAPPIVNLNAVDAGLGGTPAGTLAGATDAATGGTPAGTNAAIAAVTTVAGGTSSELAAGQNISGVTFYGVAQGYQ